ncbi:CgeB family protein [Aquabacter spiritensis]|uniref:Spore maturation protein CgeB n=1 Tax=Aquabacter spiritensis TaxID=933073 RepID=A0A4R3LVL6_9HYPH|nr:glycosyltransferase [Aquabacter spiritensis]TCT04603.1 spore maturation protein CgeB [Aquabacter spiritensis]
MRIGILATDEQATTARYIERAVREAHFELRPLASAENARDLADLDYLIVVDPWFGAVKPLLMAPCPVIGYFIDVHLDLPTRLAYARYCDHVFVAQEDRVVDFTRLPHPSVHWLPLAGDPRVHHVPAQTRIYDIGFVGKLGPPGSARRTVLEQVLSRFSTNDYARYHTPTEMGHVYSRSKIVINKSINHDLNMRFFEAMTSGALLITDRDVPGLCRIGREGEHFVTYRTADEAVEKVTYYLTHDAEREAIADCGRHLVLSQHTYAHRLAQMLERGLHSPRLDAPARHATPRTEAIWRSECMRLIGASAVTVANLMIEGHLSGPMLRNSVTAFARGLVRPVRIALSRRIRSPT